MQRYTIYFITVNALHVSGGFSAHHQELKNCTHSICYVPGLLASSASLVEFELNHASVSSKQAWHRQCFDRTPGRNYIMDKPILAVLL